MSLFLRTVAPRSIEVLGSDPAVVQSLLAWNPPFKPEHAAVAVAAAALVSVARFVLYENWKDFTVATDLSNGQVTPFALWSAVDRAVGAGIEVTEFCGYLCGVLCSWNR